jgi:hypothetical protein
MGAARVAQRGSHRDDGAPGWRRRAVRGMMTRVGRHAIAALVSVVVTACTSASRGNHEAPNCVGDGGTFTCQGQIFPGCTSSDMTGPCGSDASMCMGCIGSSPAGYSCSCSFGKWQCVGTERSCELTP